jgi:hypothetical protein
MYFDSLLHASLVLVVVFASIICSSGAATQYVNGATIFGSCASFSVLAGTAVTFNGVRTAVGTGSVGVAPGTSITGAFVQILGTKEASTAPAIACAADAMIAYGYLKGLKCTHTLANTDL